MFKRNIKIFSGLFFIVASVAYFFLYSGSLEAKFSFVSFLFFLLLFISFITLANLQKTVRGIIISSTVFFVFLLYSVINLAYFRVFNTFINFSLGQITQINFSFVDFIADFSFLIPKSIFFLSFLLFSIFILSSILSKRESGQKQFLLLHNSEIAQRKNRLARSGLFAVLLIANIAAVSVVAYYEKNPRESWWDSREYSLNCGFAGHLYGEFYQFLNGEIKTIFAKEKNEEDVNQKIKIASLPETTDKKDLARYYLSQLAGGGEKIDKKNTIPTIPETPHIIFYQLESVGSWALKQDPTPMPYLKELMAKNITVNHFFANSCQTVNAEFPSLCGFIPDSFDPISFHEENNNLNCLPSILKDEYGYKTKIFHANLASFWGRDKLVKKWGFDETYFTPYFRQKASDKKVINTMVKKIKESGRPTFNYVIGFTSHDPHNQELIDYQAKKNNVIIKPYAEPLNNSSLAVTAKEETIRNYFGFLTEIDNSIKSLYAELEKNDLSDKTIVVIYGDHRYYDFPVNSLENLYNYNEIPFVITTPFEDSSTIAQNFASQIDIAPTILNLLGRANYKKILSFMGNSIFSDNHPDSALSKCLGDITYIDNKIVLLGNARTGLYTKFYSKEKISDDIIEKYINDLKNLVKVSDEIIYTDTICEKKTATE